LIDESQPDFTRQNKPADHFGQPMSSAAPRSPARGAALFVVSSPFTNALSVRGSPEIPQHTETRLRAPREFKNMLQSNNGGM
jgi:hypothetical protein